MEELSVGFSEALHASNEGPEALAIKACELRPRQQLDYLHRALGLWFMVQGFDMSSSGL